jgi:hypothetical protein
VSVVAIKRRPKHERNAKPQAPRARGLQPKCGALLGTSIDVEGVRFELRCVGQAHGRDERHLPDDHWVECAYDPTEAA